MRWLVLLVGVYIFTANDAVCQSWPDSDADGVPDRKDACLLSKAGQRVDASGCAQQVAVTNLCLRTLNGGFFPDNCTQISSDLVKFEFARADILFSQRVVIERISDWLATVPARLMLVGHTDSVGSEAFNRPLSLLRASKVKQVFIDEFNFSPSRFEVKGVGSVEPIAENNSISGRSQNRRVEFLVIF